MKTISPEYIKAVAALLANLRTKIPSEPEHPIITRDWLYDLNKTLLQCQSGLEAAYLSAIQE